jgi:hypothetical protein
MKLTNLILTGMVALALGACSSSDNDATDPATATGALNFGFSMSASSSRATTGTADAGTAEESKVNTVTIRVVKADGSDETIKSYAIDRFNEATEGTTYRYTLKTPMEGLTPGAKTLYVSLNAADDNDVASTAITVSSYTSLDALNSSIANSAYKPEGASTSVGNFKMTGMGTATVVANSTVTGIIPVDRVVAKLDEQSKIASFAITPSTGTVKSYPVETAAGQYTTTNFAVQIQEYTYINLSKSYNNFGTFVSPSTLSIPSGMTYFQACKYTDKSNDFTFYNNANTSTISKKTFTTDHVTYCLENTENATTETYIVYKAQLKGYTGTDASAATAYTNNCYMMKKNGVDTFYKSWADLEADNDNLYSRAYSFTDDTSYADFAAKGVTKFVKGVCYYVAPIKTYSYVTAGVAQIIRNNWYVINVNSVKTMGLPVPNPTTVTELTMLDLQITVKPWIYQYNNLDL